MCDDGILDSFKIPNSKHRRIRAASVVAVAKESGIPLEGEMKEIADMLEAAALPVQSEDTVETAGE
jgi:hypothetical protein